MRTNSAEAFRLEDGGLNRNADNQTIRKNAGIIVKTRQNSSKPVTGAKARAGYSAAC
jgi:hypothetical protein